MEKKEVKMTRNEVVVLNQLLSSVKVSGMPVDAKRKLIGLKIDMGRVAKLAEEFQKETIESHKPDNFDKLQADTTEEGKKEFEELAKDIDTKVREILNPYYEEEISVLYEGITAEEFDKLTEANDLTLSAFEFLNQKLLA